MTHGYNMLVRFISFHTMTGHGESSDFSWIIHQLLVSSPKCDLVLAAKHMGTFQKSTARRLTTNLYPSPRNTSTTHRIRMYAIYGNIYHQYTPNVSIYTIHGFYGQYFFKQLAAKFSKVSNILAGNSQKDSHVPDGWFPTVLTQKAIRWGLAGCISRCRRLFQQRLLNKISFGQVIFIQKLFQSHVSLAGISYSFPMQSAISLCFTTIRSKSRSRHLQTFEPGLYCAKTRGRAATGTAEGWLRLWVSLALSVYLSVCLSVYLSSFLVFS